MTLLDRFRTQPRQKHPDPAVRLAYVEELPIGDRDEIAAFAREDEDPRVRRAAVRKLMDPEALAVIAREDRDDEVKGLASGMLRDIALEAFEGIGEADGATAVDAVSDGRTLVQIAKGALRESTALRALGRVSDARALGSVARHAALEAVRAEALGRVSDRDELLAIAMNSEFKDTALGALERLDGRDVLDQVAAGARNKSAAKRARGIIREMDGQAAAEDAQPAAPVEVVAPVNPVRTVETVEIIEAVESVEIIAPDPPVAAEKTAEPVDVVTPTASAPAAPSVEPDKEMQRRRLRLAELAQEAEAAADDHELQAAHRRIVLVRREWKDLGGAPLDPDLVARFAAAEARLSARDTETHEIEAKTRRDALVRLQQLASRVEPLPAKADLTLRAGERALRDLRTSLADVAPLPSRKDYEEITTRLKAAQAALTPKVQELRDAEDWRRFANVSVQEQLCAKMEALRAVEDPEAVARQIRELQQQWKQAADVPRAQGEALWRRFKAAHDEQWARCEAHFAAQAQARAENTARKLALCERAESLADSTNWIETAETIKRLQAEWKTIGPAARGQEKAIWERFRSACDKFFTRRHTDLAQRKTLWAENYAKKEGLAVRAEALAESTDWEPAAAELKRLQGEWRTIGPVKKSRSEAIWQRFRGASDKFFARYAQRHDIARAERVAAREAICAEIEALAAPAEVAESPNDAPADLQATTRAIRVRWQQELAARGVDRERAVALDERFNRAFQTLVANWPAAFAGTEFDTSANRRRMESLVKRIEDLATSLAGPSAGAADESPTTRLAAMLKEALAANTIGGKVDEESRWRSANDEVRQMQANWSRLGPVPDEVRRELADRFQRAARQIQNRGARRY